MGKRKVAFMLVVFGLVAIALLFVAQGDPFTTRMAYGLLVLSLVLTGVFVVHYELNDLAPRTYQN
jgi:predicted signal transduction protein with EAL and GGDEF domain